MTRDRSIYPALEAALRERLAAIADRQHYERDPGGHLERLKAAAAGIDAAREALVNVDPRLAHYLERCSYDKALAFLQEAQS
ncbi:MAG: hypothetical protein WCF18_01675 [Chthoniobacteraceae bacterium]